MFNFKTKKEIKYENITNFNTGIKAINLFIDILEWEKAKKILNQIKDIEKESLNKINYKLEKEKDIEGINALEKIKLKNIFEVKIKKLDKLNDKIYKEEEKYKKEIDKKKSIITIKKISNELKILMGNKKNNEALKLLQKFLQSNPKKELIINFFNKWKKKILKNRKIEKQREEKEEKYNTKLESMRLIGKYIDKELEKQEKEENNIKEKKTKFKEFLKKINYFSKIKKLIKRKKLIDEINILINENDKGKNIIVKQKLESIHKGLIKVIKSNNILGYDIYGKILGVDKISGDTFGLSENKKKYSFFLGDATGHGIRAGFIVTSLSRLFNKYVKNSSLIKLAYEINNGLKQELKSRNFITGVFFEIIKENLSEVNFIGMGHEPIFIYRKKTGTMEKVVPGGLAAGIRIIKNIKDIKQKKFY